MKLIYLHGFASGPMSSKAQFFRRRFEEIGVEMRVLEEAAGGDGDVRLIGSSMGGYLAALYAARHAEVSRVTLLAPAFGFARRWPLTLGAEKIAEWRRTGWLPMYHYGAKMESRVGYQLLEDAEQYEDYPDVSQPTLIFHGRRDDVVPFGYSEEFAARHPQVTLRIVESGHELLDVLEDMWAEMRLFS